MERKTGQITFEQKGIGAILSETRLRVPINQRSYAWEDEHVDDLLRDFAGVFGAGEYFLGTIVLTQSSSGLEVADGQQRLATGTILLAASRDYLATHGHEDRAKTLESQYLLKTDLRTNELDPQLHLNIDDHEFFRKCVLSQPGSIDRETKPTKRSHSLIEKAAQMAQKHVAWIVEKLHGDARINRLIDWVEFLKTDATVVVVKVPDRMNAFTMFETLNDRGLRIAQSDLLKNFLFDKAKEDVGTVHPKWAEMAGALEPVSDDDISVDYIRHFWVTKNGPTKERELSDKIKTAINTKQRAVDFASELAAGAHDYAALLNPNHAKWNAYGNSTRRHISTVNKHLRVWQIRPLMLAIAQNLPIDEARLAFRLCVNWSVRFLIVGGRGGLLDRNYAIRASEVGNRQIKTAKALHDRLSSVLPNDIEFASAFAQARVSKNYLARYYLRALELQVKDDGEPELIPNEDEEVINLEHVLPEHPNDSWGVDDHAAVAAFRLIGNMVLLKAGTNARVGNSGFEEKKKEYKSSAFILTQQVADAHQWTIEQIVQRQKNLAIIAVKTWPLFY